MRRFKQMLTKEESIVILKKGKVAVWAVAGDEDYPYPVPVNYVYSGGDIYIHSAKSGYKMDSIKRNPKCSVCVIDKDDIVPEKFTSYFRSVIGFGRAEIIESESEKISALIELCEKYSPGIDPYPEINRFLKNVALIRIRLEEFTGKQAIELITGRNSEGYCDDQL